MPANRNFPSVRYKNYQYDAVVVTGSFSATGAGVAGIHGDGFTVGYTAAGNYLVTFVDRFRHVLSAHTSLCLTTPNADFVSNAGIVAVGAAAANTMQIMTFPTATGVAADPANANDRINFTVTFSNSSLDT